MLLLPNRTVDSLPLFLHRLIWQPLTTYWALEIWLVQNQLCSTCRIYIKLERLTEGEKKHVKYLHNIFYIDDTLKYFRYIGFKMLLKINSHASFYFLKSVHQENLKSTCGFYHISTGQSWPMLCLPTQFQRDSSSQLSSLPSLLTEVCF